MKSTKGITLAPWRKKQFHRKVTSGWVRRVKCDEEKPFCQRCLRNGRKCPGYAQETQLVIHNSKGTTDHVVVRCVKPSQYDTTLQAQDFASFLRRSAPMLSMFSGANEFWTVIIPQASWKYDEVREMLLAFSSLDQYLISDGTTQIVVEGKYKDALQHYNRAIRGLTQGTPEIHNLILSSMMGWIFELVAGNFDVAMLHFNSARKVIEEYESKDARNNTGFDPIMQAVKDAGQHLHHQEFTTWEALGCPQERLPLIRNYDEAWSTLNTVIQDLTESSCDTLALDDAHVAISLWRISFDTSYKFESGEPLHAKRPIFLLHNIVLVFIDLQRTRDDEIDLQRKKRWECIMNDADYILELGYGERISKGLGMLLDNVIEQADAESNHYKRAFALKTRMAELEKPNIPQTTASIEIRSTPTG